MKRWKIVFLDIDGVLNRYFEKDEALRTTELYPDKIELINQLVQEDVCFVLSSSWRYSIRHGSDPMSEIKEAGFKGEFIDTTTLVHDDTYKRTRGMEAKEWLDQHWMMVLNFVIIDDLQYPEDILKENWVVPNREEGITQSDIDKAKSILGIS